MTVGRYLRFLLSYRDFEELLAERELLVDHVTVWSTGAAIDFVLSATRDAAAAERLLSYSAPSQTPTSTPVILQPSCSSKPRALWRKTVGIDRCSTSTMFWNRIIERSSGGSKQAVYGFGKHA
jgi:transposase-like protein